MERGFYNEDFDFEQLLRQRSDQFRMYPSEKVWKNIRRTIRHARFGYGLALLLLIGGGTYLSFKNDLFTAPGNQPLSHLAVVKSKSSPLFDQISFNTRSTALTNKADLINGRKSIPDTESGVHKTERRITREKTPLFNTQSRSADNEASPISPEENTTGITSFKSIQPAPQEESAALHETNDSDPILSNSSLPLEMAIQTVYEIPDAVLASSDDQQINWLQEQAVYELTRPRPKKLSWQLHATPTINYRNIAGQKMVNISSELTNVPMALNIQGDINNLLNHKPAMGFEMGTSLLYALNKKVSVKAGVQFNYASYDIQAYSSSSAERATIALSSVMGSESLTSYTNIRNFGGDQMKAIKNEYFQLSLPVGMEYTLLSSRRIQFTFAGTLQPTFMLNHDNYLITTDYKNYTREPSLLRHFNLNTSAEAFLSYNMGGMRIQLGPQFRYQILSSFVSRYPLRENLKEFGFKLGITKSIR